jgi:hypothetical protein
MQKITEIAVLAKPIRPARLLAKFYDVPLPMHPLSVPVDSVYGAAASLLRRSAAKFTVRDVPATEIDSTPSLQLLRPAEGKAVRQVLTEQSFRERYGHNPDEQQYRAVCVESAGKTEAVIVYRTAIRDHGIHALILMDMGFSDDDVQAIRRGLHEVDRIARKAGCDVILSLTTDPTIQSQLKQAGYLRSNETYVLLKKAVRAENQQPIPQTVDEWYFTFADHDAF